TAPTPAARPRCPHPPHRPDGLPPPRRQPACPRGRVRHPPPQARRPGRNPATPGLPNSHCIVPSTPAFFSSTDGPTWIKLKTFHEVSDGRAKIPFSGEGVSPAALGPGVPGVEADGP